MDLQQEVRDLKRRLDVAETAISTMQGQFEFISGQLRSVQLFMHNRFEAMDRRFDKMDGRFDAADDRFSGIETRLDAVESAVRDNSAKIDALPRVLAEMLARRGA